MKFSWTALVGSFVVAFVVGLSVVSLVPSSTFTGTVLWLGSAGLCGGLTAGYLVREPLSGAINGGLGTGVFGLGMAAVGYQVFADFAAAGFAVSTVEVAVYLIATVGVVVVFGAVGGGIGGRLHAQPPTPDDTVDTTAEPVTKQ